MKEERQRASARSKEQQLRDFAGGLRERDWAELHPVIVGMLQRSEQARAIVGSRDIPDAPAGDPTPALFGHEANQ